MPSRLDLATTRHIPAVGGSGLTLVINVLLDAGVDESAIAQRTRSNLAARYRLCKMEIGLKLRRSHGFPESEAEGHTTDIIVGGRCDTGGVAVDRAVPLDLDWWNDGLESRYE